MQEVGPVHRHLSRIIVNLIRPLSVRSVLDVGCGNGMNLGAIERELHPRELCGIDASPEALRMARRVVNGQFIALNAEGASLRRQFDLVLTSQVIEHIPDDEAFLRNLRQMASSYVLVTTMQGRMRPSEVLIGHLRNYTRQGLEEKMTKAGLQPMRTVEWGFPFYSPLYRSAIEWIGGQGARIRYDRKDRFIAWLLHHLYRLNSSRRGDVLIVLGRTI